MARSYPLVALAFVMASGIASATPVEPFTIFTVGDSLSDTGTNTFDLLSPPYFSDEHAFTGSGITYQGPAPRYSDGPVWIERLESRYGGTGWDAYFRDQWPKANGVSLDASFGVPDGTLGTLQPSDPILFGGTNFASGGAQTDGFAIPVNGILAADLQNQGNLAQLALDGSLYGFDALTNAQVDRSLFVVQGGGNDFFKIQAPSDIPTVLQDAVDRLGGIIGNLAAEGATQFLVPNLPGYVAADDWVAGTLAEIRALSQAFNALLAQEIGQLRASLGIDIYEVDWFGLFDDMVADPQAYGLANISEPCLNLDASLGFESFCNAPESFLMFDALHPNSVAHQAMADSAWAALTGFNARLERLNAASVPEPATLGLGLLALAIAARRSRRVFVSDGGTSK